MTGKQWRRAGIIAGITALAICAAPLFVSGLQRPDVAKLMAPRRSPYCGVIRVWQISDFNAPYSGKAALLEKAARRVERRWAGVYYEVENVTPEEYDARLEKGEAPDMVSFSSGWQGESVYFQPYAQSIPLRAPFSRWFEAYPNALPWLACSQVLLENLDKTAGAGGTPETPQALLAAIAAQKGKNGETGGALSAAREALLALAEAGGCETLLEEGVLAGGCANEDADAWRTFRQGKSAYFLGGRARLITLQALEKQGKGFRFAQREYPAQWERYLEVQFLGVCKMPQESKAQMCEMLAAEVVSPALQKVVLENMGCIPVIEMDTQEMPTVDLEVYEDVCRPVTLPPFSGVETQQVEKMLAGEEKVGLIR